MPSGFTTLDGFWPIDGLTASTSVDSISIPADSSTLLDGSYTADTANMHISPEGASEVDNSWAYVPEEELIAALKQITGSTINQASDFTASTTLSSAIYVGETSQFDTNTTTDLNGYGKTFDDEAQLGATGYIVNSNGNNLYVLGGPGGSGSDENSAIDSFLQSLGMQEYGPIDINYGNSLYGSSNHDSHYLADHPQR